MLVHILLPRFWVAIEELRRPDLLQKPVIIGPNFQKSTARGAVLMANVAAEEHGVHAGMSLAHARQICPEAVVLSAETPVYSGVWDDVLDLLLSYTPLVQSLGPGEAVCDVSGCDRLFGEPVFMAREVITQIERSTGLAACAGVAANRLVAEVTARKLANVKGSPAGQVGYIPPGKEAGFLAPFPVSILPDIDPDLLITFQVLGLKEIGHLTLISEAAFERRFGPLGRRLARFARGKDDRPVQPIPPKPAIRVSRGWGDDGLFTESEVMVRQVLERLAVDLSAQLRQAHLAGRLLSLSVRAPRRGGGGPLFPSVTKSSDIHLLPARALSSMEPNDGGNSQEFPAQDSRIHSMLPQPSKGSPNRREERRGTGIEPVEWEPPDRAAHEVGLVLRASARLATRGPLNDCRSLRELAGRLLDRVLTQVSLEDLVADPQTELHLEMRHFAPPEQMSIPGLDNRQPNARLGRLHRQEQILAERFGSSPFRHLVTIDPDSVLPERSFRWADGLGR